MATQKRKWLSVEGDSKNILQAIKGQIKDPSSIMNVKEDNKMKSHMGMLPAFQ